MSTQRYSGSAPFAHKEPCKTVASGSNVGREAQLYGSTASIAGRQCNAQQVWPGSEEYVCCPL